MSDDPQKRANALTYAQAGVSIDAGEEMVDRIKPAAKRTERAGVLGGLGGFGALFDLKAAGYEDPLLVAATDGVGTKLRIGVETGIMDGLGVDLVAMCVNDLICQGAEPLFFLDYFATGKLDPEAGAKVVEGVAEGCLRAGCALIGGETAEMPGMYQPGDFDLAGFAVGAVERGGVLPREAREGDVILGLASAGAHSNGFSLIRRVVADLGLWWDQPAPFESGRPLGEALLEPTRIYVKPLLAALRDPELGPAVTGMAHITGGGLTENLPRIFGEELAAEIDLSAWTPSPVFPWLCRSAGIEEAEMLRAFNCGIGMAVIVRPEAAEAVAAALTSAGERVSTIGRLAPRASTAAVYKGALFE